MKAKGIIAILAIALIFSGCQKDDVSEESPLQDTEASVEPSESSEFNWKMAEGDTIRVMFNNHPYADAIIAELAGFEELTGIQVDFSLTEEEYYFDKVTYALSSQSTDMDVFMTGVEQLWHYDNLGYIEDLTPYVEDESKTDIDYDMNDFFPELREILMIEEGINRKLVALPLGFELFSLAYNKRIFEEKGLEPPKTFEEMVDLSKELYEHSGQGTYGISIRGTKNWSMINTAYISYYSIFGGKDFITEGDDIMAAVDSQESVEMNRLWADLVRNGTSSKWENMTWYNCADELGYGKAAMFLDADIVSLYVNNNVEYQEAGNIGWVPLPLPEGIEQRYSNVWTWTLSMNKSSSHKDASWLFMQYFTGKDQLYRSATVYNNGDMPRQSIWEDQKFRENLASNDGYIETFEATIGDTDLLYTPHIHFFETATVWAEYIQRIVLDPDADVEEILNELADKMNDIVNQ